MATLTAVSEIWTWTKSIAHIRELNELSEQQMLLIKSCKEKLPSDFSNNKYCFPSKITETLASQYTNFNPKEFSGFKFINLLEEIWDNQMCINEESISAILIMLIDVALYRAFTIVRNLSHGRFFYQLNMCVILDAMIIKPDRHIGFDINIISILTEVSKKAIPRIDNLDIDTIWTLAMLNYKVHLYENSITFFVKYIEKNSNREEDIIQSRIIHAQIYIGYCYEKSESFDEAIELFENILLELNSKDKISVNDSKLIREINHGLGHFFNERAVFGTGNKRSEDILNARYHMANALSEKADYYSCYGSLFHEYGDYQTAKNIFNEASRNTNIIQNDELLSELQFYIAQTDASLATNEDERVKQAEINFKQFEDYCKKTFNYDGIIHARVFKIRTFLRELQFSSNNFGRRTRTIKLLDAWYRDLTEYSLSSYASKSIKIEYNKVLCVLDIFKLLYADNCFEWHTEDLRYYLQKFMKYMPEDVIRLDYTPDTVSDKESNLYQIALGGLWVWCVGSSLLSNDYLKKLLVNFEEQTDAIIPVLDKQSAHVSIKGNGKPDLVVLMPPHQEDRGFEQELEEIKSSVSELYFVYYPDSTGVYNSKWFETNISSQGKKYTCYSAKCAKDALVHAYCLRSFEILRKELLRPIPLFSLAPTHFSSSYDFQLGETLEIRFDSINEHNDDSKTLRESLSFIDNKYSQIWMDKVVHKTKEFIGKDICVSGIINICCPAPLYLIGADNYIGYYVSNTSALKNLSLPHNVEAGKLYIIKALPSYKEVFWDLEKALREQGDLCEQDESDTCIIFSGYNLLSAEGTSNISNLCKKIISVIFNMDIE